MSEQNIEEMTWAEVWEAAGQELEFLPPDAIVRKLAMDAFFAYMLFF